ncbi:MAG TPA: transaldolase [Burkholderiales bacterium]|jgi:transaldolase|nr:transaldolase [Burkholderiales bacterium]
MDSKVSESGAPLRALAALGQSIWLDFIKRDLIESGELARRVGSGELAGMTSNPAIFEKAIAGSGDYDRLLAEAARDRADTKTVYERLAVRDIRDAADALRPVYDATKARDGYVSLEVSPHLAHDTPGTVEEAHRLWRTVDRPNLMIKVPGTPAGVPAFAALIEEGVNVNVTLLFSRAAHRAVADAYVGAVGKRAARGREVGRIASVASFFVSRIDTAVDKLLGARIAAARSDAERSKLQGLLGKAAIANAKLAYQTYLEVFGAPGWTALAAAGAQTQRVLWASTSTKNPDYRDVVYIEELIGPDTVNTVPPATLDAFRDHGRARASLAEDVAGAHRVMDDLAAAGIALEQVTDELLDDGVRLFADAFDQLLGAIGKRTGR